MLNTLKKSVARVFRFKSNVFLFFMCLALTFATILSMNIIDYEQRKNDYLHAYYPEGYSMLVDRNEDSVTNSFDHTELVCSKEKVNVDNIQGSVPYSIKLIGVDHNFLSFPLQSLDHDLSCRFTSLSKGRVISAEDQAYGAAVFMMYESQAKMFLTGGEPLKLEISGISLSLCGTLKDTPDIIRDSKKEKHQIAIYVPETIFEKLYRGVSSHCLIFKSGNKDMFSIFGSSSGFSTWTTCLPTKTNWLREPAYLTIEIILFVISFTSFLSLGMLSIKNRSTEIGVRRAVGATKDDICFMFLAEGFFILLSAVLISFILNIAIWAVVSSVWCSYTCIYAFFFDWIGAAIFSAAFIFVCSIGLLVPSIFGAFTNISTVLTEEK